MAGGGATTRLTLSGSSACRPVHSLELVAVRVFGVYAFHFCSQGHLAITHLSSSARVGRAAAQRRVRRSVCALQVCRRSCRDLEGATVSMCLEGGGSGVSSLSHMLRQWAAVAGGRWAARFLRAPGGQVAVTGTLCTRLAASRGDSALMRMPGGHYPLARSGCPAHTSIQHPVHVPCAAVGASFQSRQPPAFHQGSAVRSIR